MKNNGSLKMSSCRNILFALSLFSVGSDFAGAEDRPNFLLIVADDSTWRDFGFTGNPDVQTPHLDQLRKEGVYFSHMYTPATTCSPSRHALYTGLFSIRSGAYPNHTRVYDGTRSLFTYLKEVGYRVGLQGKEHVGPKESFPYEHIGGRNPDDFGATEAFLTENGEQPWLLVYASNDPHSAWNRGPRDLYEPDDITIPPYLHDNQTTRELLCAYYREITKLDSQVGELMKLLETTDQVENTLVMFVSEQGSSFPYGGKWSLYDNGIRAATIVRWPGKVPPNSTDSSLVQYVDVVPTFLEAAGIDELSVDTGCPDPSGLTGFDGFSFLNSWNDETNVFRDIIFSQQTTVGINGFLDPYPMRAARDGRYKLIWNLAPENTYFIGGIHKGQPIESWRADAETDPELAKRVEFLSHRPEFELYDVQNDEYETHNLAGDPEHAKIRAHLHTAIQNWMAQQGDRGMKTELEAPSRQSIKRQKNRKNATKPDQ